MSVVGTVRVHQAQGTAMPQSAGWLVAVGGLCGLAWAAGLRGVMAEVAAFGSSFTWSGTFVWVLLPGVGVGLLLGWSEHLRRTGGRPGWRWLALSPLLLSAVLFRDVNQLAGLSLAEGAVLGSGALVFPMLAMSGGYALSRRGPIWARVVAGVPTLSLVPVWVLTVESFAGRNLALTTPRGAWVFIHVIVLQALLVLACSIPHRDASLRDPEPAAGHAIG